MKLFLNADYLNLILFLMPTLVALDLLEDLHTIDCGRGVQDTPSYAEDQSWIQCLF